MACNTDGAVVVVIHVLVEMGHSHERGKKEQQYKQCGKSIVPGYGATFKHERRLIRMAELVKLFFMYKLTGPSFFMIAT